MFTLKQVNEVHDKLGKATGLLAYLNALSAIGVEKAVSFVTDGHTEFQGKDNYVVITPPAHEKFLVAEVSDKEKFAQALKETNYQKMSKSLADSGTEKWIFDTDALTMTYYDKAGNQLLKEDIQ